MATKTAQEAKVAQDVQNTQEVQGAQETTAVATTETTAVAVPQQNYIVAMLESTKTAFMEANAGMDLDFVRMGEHIKINKKGNFILRSDENASFGDTLDVVIAMGEQRHTLWGAKESPEDGELICMAKTFEEAEQELQEYLELRPDAAERYSKNDIQLRYLAYVVPVSTLSPEDMPDVFLLSLAQSDTFGFASHAKSVYRGDKDKGVKKGTGVNAVVTRLVTEERKVKNSTDTYLGVKFEILGAFKPEDYGIKA